MANFVAFLRAINVGGTGKLAMSELRALCEALGFKRVTTYIQSGNVVFASVLSEGKVKAKLEGALAEKMGKPVGVLVRTADELEALLAQHPFGTALPNQVAVWFLDEEPSQAAYASLKIPGSEQVELGARAVFVHYPDGMGNSKLKLPCAKTATARNLNTVNKLAAMARELER